MATSKTSVKKAAPAKAPAKKPVKTEGTKVTKAAVAKKPAAAKAKPAAKAKANGGKQPVTTDQRRYYIEVAAYYMAERRGFVGGNPSEDWAAAEAEIDRLLAEGRLNP